MLFNEGDDGLEIGEENKNINRSSAQYYENVFGD